MQQVWSSSAMDWINNWKNNWQYNSSNQEIEELRSFWNPTTNVWVINAKVSSLYNGNIRTEQLTQNWNSGTNYWDNWSKISWQYDANNQILEEFRQNWNGITFSWQNDIKYNWEYNQYGNLIAREYASNWNSTGLYFNSRTRDEYTCRLVPNGISETDNQALLLYPNPLNSTVLNITLVEPEELWIMDMQGKVVYKNQLSRGENQLEVSQLQNGLYIVKAGNSVQKLIKE